MNHTAPAQGYFPHESGVEEIEAPTDTPCPTPTPVLVEPEQSFPFSPEHDV